MEEPSKARTAADFELLHAQEARFVAIETYSHTSFGKDVLKRLFKNKGAVFGMTMIIIIIAFAVIVPMVSRYTYKEAALDKNYLPPRVPGLSSLGICTGYRNGVDIYAQKGVPSNLSFFFGTDSLGRDQWTRLWNGTRISLLIAFIAVAIDLLIGMTFGLISGYFGGKVDFFMQRFVEILNGIPQIVLVTLFALILQPGMASIILALLISGWIPMSRVCRAQVLRQKEQEYVLAARALHASDFKIIFGEVVPNVLGQVVIMSMFSIPSAIFTESYLAFVGLGVRAPMASLGSLVSTGYKSLLSYPYLVIIPVTVLALLMICFNLFADGLRDAFDPTMKDI
jgi:ABC-type dipeptide/oligopeptide/nickel transport systems, permease components